jgi:hypothetical protein
MGVDIELASVFTEEVAKAACDRAFADLRDVRRRGLDDAQATRDASQKVFDEYAATGGYFRDPYNRFSLLPVLGMSWQRDVDPLLLQTGELPIPAARVLLAELESRHVTEQGIENVLLGPPTGMTAFVENLIGGREEVTELSDDDRAEAWEWFTTKRKQLIALLRRSIELNEPLKVSM